MNWHPWEGMFFFPLISQLVKGRTSPYFPSFLPSCLFPPFLSSSVISFLPTFVFFPFCKYLRCVGMVLILAAGVYATFNIKI